MEITSFLDNLNGVKKIREDNYMAKCPAHVDDTASLSVKNLDDKILINCFAGCDTKEILNCIGLTMMDLYKDNNMSAYNKANNIEAVYKYTDVEGNVLHEKIRFNKKGFANRHYENGNVVWNMKGVTPIIYNLTNVVKAINNHETIFLVEGEKDCDRLNKLGLIATTNYEGAGKNKFKKIYAEYFKNANVVICQDNDQAGREAVSTIIEVLSSVVGSIKNVDLSLISNKDKYDISNYFDEGYTKENFLKMVDETPFIDVNSNMSYKHNTECNVAKLGLIEGTEGYMFRTFDARSGETIDKVISNFLIKIIELIKTDKETFIKIAIGNNTYKTEKIINIKSFDNKAKFLDAISDINFFFKGKDDHLQDIKYLISQRDYKSLTGLNNVGINTIEKKIVFATDTRVIDLNYKVQDDLIVPKDRIVIKSNILEISEISSNELKEISPYIFNFNSLEIAASILGTLVTFFLKPLWAYCCIRTKHLYIWGEAGAGKTETRKNIIEPFFGINESKVLDCNNITQFSLNKYTESSNVFPVLLEEYKPWKMRQSSVDIISSCLRNTYDMTSGIRGNKDQSLNEYPQLSPVVLIGESFQSETATKERGMIVNFSKLESRFPERRKAFNELSKSDNKLLMQKFGKSMLDLILSTDVENIVSIRNNIIKQNISTITDDRVKDTAINGIVGIYLIKLLYDKLGLDFTAETGYKLDDIYSAINKNCLNEILDGSAKNKSIIDNTLELISNMKARGLLTEGVHYTYVNNKTELALNINLMFDNITKYKKDYVVDIELLSNKTQFIKQLQKTEYFIARKTVRFTTYFESFNAIKEETKAIKAYVLDINVLRKMELDIDDLLS